MHKPKHKFIGHGGLVLTRFEGESIQIGDEIIVSVVAIQGSKVRLSVQAPRDMRVDRYEVAVRIANETAPPK